MTVGVVIFMLFGQALQSPDSCCSGEPASADAVVIRESFGLRLEVRPQVQDDPTWPLSMSWQEAASSMLLAAVCDASQQWDDGYWFLDFDSRGR